MSVPCSFGRAGDELVVVVVTMVMGELELGVDSLCAICETCDGHSHSIGERCDGDIAMPDPLTLACTSVVNLSACEDVGKAVPACGLTIPRVEEKDNGVNSYSSYVDAEVSSVDLSVVKAEEPDPYVGVIGTDE